MRTKKGCEFTLKAENGEQFELQAFQSPRGLRSEDGKRPSIIQIDCYQEFNQRELFRFIEYLQDLGCAMSSNVE